MIREYAVDPASYTRNIDSLQRFFNDFRAENGRVVSAIPRNWERAQQNTIRAMQLKPIQKQKCFDEISKIAKHSLIPGITIPREIEQWIDQARYAKPQANFEAIITCNMDDENEEFDYSTIMFSSPQNWTIDNTESVRRSAPDLAQAISTSLSIAEVSLFIDPHFDPKKARFRNVMREFIVRLASGRQQCRKAYLHTAIQPYAVEKERTRLDIENGLQAEMQPLLPPGFTLETWIWPNTQMHDRFVLTKQVGYSFGHGLDENTYQGAIEVNVNRLSETARQREFRKFSNYALCQGDPIVIVGS